ncbi:MAG TPA: hypothetical protein ENG87_00605 [Candidatus Pacearchaeota archaeon]|nr:hypothetical protein BMS3Abin17_00750 [archaeon BMS3Abin17]HDK41849.1 hypothetical protein [Candidatus Pacearchaeota archaeon]HDZ60877.1 hypothetical protein [Candidatus Pacearchaeota archaeon]
MKKKGKTKDLVCILLILALLIIIMIISIVFYLNLTGHISLNFSQKIILNILSVLLCAKRKIVI